MVGGSFLLKIPGGGGGGSRRGRVRAGVASANYWGIFFLGGGGAQNFFLFRGRNVHQVLISEICTFQWLVHDPT